MIFSTPADLFSESEMKVFAIRNEEIIAARNKEAINYPEKKHLIMQYYDEGLNVFVWKTKENRRKDLNQKHVRNYFLIGLPLFLIGLLLLQLPKSSVQHFFYMLDVIILVFFYYVDSSFKIF